MKALENLNLGLLILRVGVGGMMMSHGIPKLIAGGDKWEKLGSSIALIGIKIPQMYMFFGLLASVFEAIGGLLIVIGFYFRTAAFLVAGTMIMATIYHVQSGHDFSAVSHPLELAIVFVAFIFTGPGTISLKK